MALTEKETNILKFLPFSAGDRTRARALLNEVWGYGPAVATHTLETHIYRELRKKIQQNPGKARISDREAAVTGFHLQFSEAARRRGVV